MNTKKKNKRKKSFKRLLNTHCPKDYSGNHFWKIIGIDKGYEYWKCYQCNKYIKKKIIYL